MNTKQIINDVIGGKIKSFSVLNFYKVVYLNYKSGVCIRKGPFTSGEDFVDLVKFLIKENIKFEPTIGCAKIKIPE